MDKPWHATPTESIPQLPAMLGGEELQFLYYMGQTSEGLPLVDLGTFLGGSAAAMAAGAESVGSASKVYTYDLFKYGKWCAGFDLGTGWNNGDDLLPYVKDRTLPWADRMEFFKGDIAEQPWTNGPIGALFVDFTQNWFHHNHVTKTFLPHLKLGGILAHQDYVYIVCYWLHVFMERYAEHFELISPLIMNGTAAWRYTKPLPEEALSRGLNELLSVNEMESLLDRSIARYEELSPLHASLIKLARVRFYLHTQGLQRAQEALDDLKPDWLGHPNISPLISVTQGNIDTWRANGGPYPEGFFRA